MDYRDILQFWFGDLDDFGRSDAQHRKCWFQKNPEFDEKIRKLFLPAHEGILKSENNNWLENSSSRLAYLLVLDQFSRNMFRDQPGMFDSDLLSLRVVREGLDLNMDRELFLDGRVFFYMPLMHSEELCDQNECVEQFKKLREELQGEVSGHVDHNLEYALKHREVIERFSRFPHRNEILSRESTPEEVQFLKEPGSKF
jgi:uncharacterized protein (DUF924 family)